MNAPSVTLIAVSYFGAADAYDLLESLVLQTEKNWRLLVVDNTSDGDEAEQLQRLEQRDDRVEILVAPRNLGYLGGAAWCLRQRPVAGDVVVLNTDLTLGSCEALEALRQRSQTHEDIGMIAPSIISGLSGADQNPHLEHPPTVRASLVRALAMNNPVTAQLTIYASALRSRRRHSRPAERRRDQKRDVYAPHGSFMYFTEHYFDGGGSLEHPLFLFAEEIFVAEECRKAKLRVTFDPAVVIQHREHASTGLTRSWTLLRDSGRASRYVLRTTLNRRRRNHASNETSSHAAETIQP